MSKIKCTFGGCNAIVDSSDGVTRCPKHMNAYCTEKKVYHDKEYFRAKHFYSSGVWKRLSIEYRRLNPLCEHCQARGRVVKANCVDHIKEISDGGSKTDWNNLQSLCNSCHAIKTGNEKKKRERRKRNNGFGSINDY